MTLLRLCLVLLLATAFACSSGRGSETPPSALAELRKSGPGTESAEVAGEWLLAELLAPGGSVRTARAARTRLDQLGEGGMLASMARGLDDSVHGRLRSAPDHYLKAVRAAKTSSDSRAPFVAWFAANRAVALRRHARDLWPRWRRFVEESMAAPLGMGWRARGELVEWWADEADTDAARNMEQRSAEQFGCVEHVRLAGPFGHGMAPDSHRSFAAERPGPWPDRWEPDADAAVAPRVLPTERHGCFVRAREPGTAGIHYAETFLELPQPRELLIAAQGALALWIDDAKLLDRDPRIWGVWPKFGVQVWLEAGRHRVLVRLADSQTSIRALTPDGRPAHVASSVDAALPYQLVAPKRTGEPNVVSRFVRRGDVLDPKDDLTRFLAAYLAWVEGQGDLASVLSEPLVKDPSRATGVVLAASAAFSERDPIFEPTQVRDLVRELHERAVKKDPELWESQLVLALWQAERAGATDAVRRVKALAARFPDVAAIPMALARLYGELGWTAEYGATAKRLAEQFPDDPEVLTAALTVLESQGDNRRADELVARLEKIDPDGETGLIRALAREDFATALRELKKLGERRPERKDLADRVSDVMVRAGNDAQSWKELERAVAKDPRNPLARLGLADARLALGERDALRRALVDAAVNGAATSNLEDALDLVEDMTELEPFRLDARAVVREHEQRGAQLEGTAARVLDYAAIWVRADGSSRMLEHEVVRIQSPEAIAQLAEHPRLEGVVLHMRVLKKDGRILEPEEVPGKPTLTFPHLEVGDYIETEHVVTKPSESRGGKQYVSPHWFFREENIAYARSEFVVITPEDKPVAIETQGNVIPATVTREPGVVARRWRVDQSPAAPVEPGSPPITEFLPSVRLGWGIKLDRRLRDLGDTLADVAPVDPRVARIARRIVEPLPATERFQRAQKLYRWVLANVEEGQETDGRRVVVGKRGNRWRGFITLCRSLGIEAGYAVARNRLAPPPVGPIAEATQFSEPAVRVQTERGPIWLTVSNKYAPFGYLPPEIRGVPAYLLGRGNPEKTTTPTHGAEDGVSYEGKVALAADGSAKLELVQRFTGKYAMAVRSAFGQLPEAQLRDLVESKLLGRALRGARLVSHRVEHLDDLDEPLLLHMRAEMSSFAHRNGTDLAISPPFSPRVTLLAALPARHTPLLLAESTHQVVRLEITLPAGASLTDGPHPTTIRDSDRTTTIADRLAGNLLVLERTLDIPAGRVQPAAYSSFLDFARKCDAALGRDVRIRVK